MTYQSLGYWIAQANDLSTGTHPTGWTSGQRYSETATEWKTMYDAEYAQARDNSAGQNGSGLGAAHPTGWSAGQLWSETALEWNTMYGTEWRAARDPQGFSYSYPGQAANAVYWSQSANYWRGQYDAYVGYYNGMVSSRDYWQHTVAHNDASVWDTRYNAGYSAGHTAGAATKSTSAVGANTSGTGGLPQYPSFSNDLAIVTCPRTGLAHASCRIVSNGDDSELHLLRNGGLVISGGSANGGQNTTFAVHGNIQVNGGDTISVRATGSGDSGLSGGYLLVTVGSQ